VIQDGVGAWVGPMLSWVFNLSHKSNLIYKSNMVSVRPSVCVDKNWAVPGRFFQSLPVPCGVFWGGGARESPVKHGAGGASRGGQHGRGGHGWGRTGRGGGASTGEEGPGGGGASTGEEGPGGGEIDGCIMHQVHTTVHPD
jgi:hypothetical protein